MTNPGVNETNQDLFYNAIKTVFDNWTGYQVKRWSLNSIN
jgi:hypothetical protein